MGKSSRGSRKMNGKLINTIIANAKLGKEEFPTIFTMETLNSTLALTKMQFLSRF